jgi:hypothetical protein
MVCLLTFISASIFSLFSELPFKRAIAVATAGVAVMST